MLLRLLSLSCFFTLFSCGTPSGDYFGHVPELEDPTHLHFCNSGEPEHIDPAKTTSMTGVKFVDVLFSGLTAFDSNGFHKPDIATHWEIAPDFKTFTFHLRKDAIWSDKTPITSEDFAYSLARILNPYSLSPHVDTMRRINHGILYYNNRIRKLLADQGPFKKGDLVQIIGLDDELEANNPDLVIPDSNQRISETPLYLRDKHKLIADAYATVPAGEPVIIIERSSEWTYVFWPKNSGKYGWVKHQQLTKQPHGKRRYQVQALSPSESKEQLTPKTTKATVLGQYLLMTPDILGIKTPDPYTLVIHTQFPQPYFIKMTPSTSFRLSPRQAVSRRPERWSRPEHIVTSGPFHMTAWIRRDYIELIRSKTYFDTDRIKLNKITSYNMNDQAATINYYLQGSCDMTRSLPTSYLPILRGEKRQNRRYKDYFDAPYLGIYFYLINTEKLSNRHLRRAFSFAVDRTVFPKILQGGQIPTAGFVPGTPISRLSPQDKTLCGVTEDQKGVALIVQKDTLCYVPPLGLDFDPQKAQQELALAKQQLGDAFPKTFSVTYNSGSEGHKLIAEYLQSVWSKLLGVSIELQTQEWKTFLKDTRTGNYEIARMGNIGNLTDPESSFLTMFRCDNPDNRTRWCNKDFEALFDKAERTSNKKERLLHVQAMEKLMLEESPILPLYIYTQHALQKPYVRGAPLNLIGKTSFAEIWLDPDWNRP